MGKKRQPVYKIVAADSRSPRDGKYLEAIGTYNPKTDPQTITLAEDRALYWLNVGAQPTDTVRSILKNTGVTLKKELVKRGLSDDQVQIELEKWKSLKEASAKGKSRRASVKSEIGTTEVQGASSGETAAQ
jgi:small subunit ribosomal protein S16